MSDSRGDYGTFVPVQASLRKNMGEIVDLWMEGRIALLRKTVDQINGENNPEKLEELRMKLNDALLSKEDLEYFGAIVGTMLSTAQNNLRIYSELKNLSRDDHRGHGH
jgi:hypothetical protein